MTDQQPLPEVVGKAVKRQMISRVQVKRHFKIYVVSVLMNASPRLPPVNVGLLQANLVTAF